LASAIVEDKKYEEIKYRHKKEIVDTSDIKITIGNKLMVDGFYYGTVVRESELFYYIHTKYTDEEVEYQKSSIIDKVAKELIVIVD